jgi:preprotein translocase subunit YajC
VTTGGLHGKIVELKELTAIIDAGNNVKLKINRAAISMEASMLLANDVSED